MQHLRTVITACATPELIPRKARFHELKVIEEEKVIQKDLYPTKEGLTMGETLRVINEHSGGNATIVTDVGQHQMVAVAMPNSISPRVM